MESCGLWMLVAVALSMVATGLPAWVVLVGVSFAFAAGGIAAGAFDATLFTAVYPRLVGLLENDLLQALPLYVLMGVLINRTALADTLYRAARTALAPTRRGVALAGLFLGVLLAPMSGSAGASVAMLSRTLYPRLAAAGYPEERNVALVCVASTLGVVVPPSLVLILLGDAMMRAHTEASHLVASSARIVNTQDVFHAALVPCGDLPCALRRDRRLAGSRCLEPARGRPLLARRLDHGGGGDSAHRCTARRRGAGLPLRGGSRGHGRHGAGGARLRDAGAPPRRPCHRAPGNDVRHRIALRAARGGDRLHARAARLRHRPLARRHVRGHGQREIRSARKLGSAPSRCARSCSMRSK